MTPAQKLGAQLAEKRKALGDLYAAHKTADVERPYNFTAEQVEDVRAKNAELEDLARKYEEIHSHELVEANLKAIDQQLGRPDRRIPFPTGAGKGEKPDSPSMGEAFVRAYYKHDEKGDVVMDGDTPVQFKDRDVECKEFNPVEFKTTMTTSAGWAPEARRSGRVELSLVRPLRMADMLPTIRLSLGNSYVYMQETTYTNNAAPVAEAAAYPESALALDPVTVNIRKIGTFIPVTEEQLSDVDGMRDYIDSRLSLMVETVLDTEILTGDNTGQHLNGFATQVTQAQAKGADPVFDAIFKGMTKVQTIGMANPSAVVIHPNDWQDIRLTRTTDGIYILGNPADVGPTRLFGVPIVATTGQAENTALVGDFATHSALIYRWGLEVKVSDQHSDFWVKDIFAIKARVRAALAVFRILAFCEVTGI